MAEPEIAVVVPVRNGRRTIDATIHVIAGEVRCCARPGSVEVLVVDDASDDGTAEVARDALTRSGAYGRVLSRATRGGPNAARNEAAQATSAPVLVFVDGDDLPLPGAILALAAAVDDVDVIAGGSYVVPGRRSRTVTIPASSRRAFGYPYAVGGALATSRALLDRVGWFDAAILQGGTEVDLCIRAQLRAQARIVPVDVALVRHRVPMTLLGRARVHFRRERGHRRVVSRSADISSDRDPWLVRADRAGGHALLGAEIAGRWAGRLVFGRLGRGRAAR